MMALFIAVTAVAVERFIKRKRLRLHEVLADVGWLTLLFAFIEVAYLKFVEALTLNYGAVARPFWYTEWWVFKDLLLSVAIAVMLIFTSVWLESAGIRVELRRPQLAKVTAVMRSAPPPKEAEVTAETEAAAAAAAGAAPQKKCDIEWREAA